MEIQAKDIRTPMWAFCAVLGFYLVFLGGFYELGLRINTSPSLPQGVYRVTHEEITKGSLVVFCLPHSVAEFGRQRGYVENGTCEDGSKPALKIVKGIAGDWVTVKADMMRDYDSEERLVPHVNPGRYQIQAGEIWVEGTHSHSWDSRNYGPIAVASVQSTARGVWTWQTQDSK